MPDIIFPKLCDDDICTGCSACVNICAFGALTIGTNGEGFYRPKLDTNKCIGCQKCLKSCPVISKPNLVNKNGSCSKVWAAWHKNASIRKNSSSGGAFSALASMVLRNGGLVVGAAYNEHLEVCHIIVDDESELYRLRQSKYVQSNMGLCMRDVRKLLNKGKMVMFVGTPCQCAGMRKVIGKDNENLLLVDFICHGVPSATMLNKWIQWLRNTVGMITNIEFRNKCKGWYDAVRVVTLQSGKKKILKGKNDSYWVGFNNNNNNLQFSCYDCQFLGLPRLSDITIADFWGIGHHISFGHKTEIENGVSMVIANHSRAVEFVEKCDDLEKFERTIEEVTKRNQAALHSCVMPKSRKTFYTDLEKLPFNEFIDNYLIPDNKTKLVKIWREYLPSWLIRSVRTLKQK